MKGKIDWVDWVGSDGFYSSTLYVLQVPGGNEAKTVSHEYFEDPVQRNKNCTQETVLVESFSLLKRTT